MEKIIYNFFILCTGIIMLTISAGIFKLAFPEYQDWFTKEEPKEHCLRRVYSNHYFETIRIAEDGYYPIEPTKEESMLFYCD